MAEVDLSRLPTGELGWSRFVEWAASSDDRIERFFLELKSDIDLTGKHGRHKVAKFILGAANRDPARAQKRFGGHALLVLGISENKIIGINGFEAKDLEREVQKFTGADGPIWDFERIPLEGGRDVVVVVVDPPLGVIWPCLSDGEGLTNGEIYIRNDGETKKATGAEVKAMLARSPREAALPLIDVTLLGNIYVVRISREELETRIKNQHRAYLSQIAPRATTISFLAGGPGLGDRRTEQEFRDEVAAWSEKALRNPASGLSDIASKLFDGIQLRASNPSRTFLKDVQIEIELPADVIALEWSEPNDDLSVFPDRPKKWGGDTFLIPHFPHLSNISIANRDGVLRAFETPRRRLSVALKSLRPEDTFVSDDDEVVLVSFVESGREERTDTKLQLPWRVTAGDVNDVLDGTLEVEVRHVDWIGAMTAAADAENVE